MNVETIVLEIARRFVAAVIGRPLEGDQAKFAEQIATALAEKLLPPMLHTLSSEMRAYESFVMDELQLQLAIVDLNSKALEVLRSFTADPVIPNILEGASVEQMPQGWKAKTDDEREL